MDPRSDGGSRPRVDPTDGPVVRMAIPMSRKARPDRSGFTCIHCRHDVPGQSWGTRHRNHCPRCLWSRHVDDEPGDRRSPCGQPMQPIGISLREDGEWSLIHRCTGCRLLRVNRIAGDDHELALLSLALRPLAQAPFPIDDLRPSWPGMP